MTVCTGIANIWARDPVAAATAARSSMEAFPDRFLLGLGVSHRQQVDPRGHRYDKPVAHMRSYLAGLDLAPYHPDPELPRIPRVLAALRPPMIELARECADGMLSYLVTPGHTAMARELLGPRPLLCAEQAILLSADPGRGTADRARAHELVLRSRQLPAEPARTGIHGRRPRGGGSDRIIDGADRMGRCRRDRRARARAPRRRRGPRLHPAAAGRRRSLRPRVPARARARRCS